jgi:hypothetical protein
LVQFELSKSNYLAQVDALPAAASAPRLKLWDWGSTGGVAVVRVQYFLVYDDSDQIALPPESRSSDWKIAATKGRAFTAIIDPPPMPVDHSCTGGCTSVTKLDGHFYLALQQFE